MNKQDKIALTYDIAGAGVALHSGDQCKIPRIRLANFCETLRLCTEKLLGVSFYYPDFDAGFDTCRYEWMVAHGLNKYAIRLGILFRVGTTDLERVSACISYGSGHPSAGERPNLSEQEIAEFASQIVTVINKAEAAGGSQHFNNITYVKLARGMGITFKNSIVLLGSIILPTVCTQNDSLVSPLISQLTASSLEVAKNASRRQNGLICALLTLTAGRVVEEYRVDWKGAPRLDVLDSLDPLPQSTQLFPSEALKSSNFVDLIPDLEQQFKWVTEAYENLHEEWRNRITNAYMHTVQV